MNTITVTTLMDGMADDGQTTLREAIAMMGDTAGGDRIEFADGLSGTIALTDGALDLMASGYNVIDGDVDDDGMSDITISGGGMSGVFGAGTGRYTLQDLTITDGVAENGGGLHVGEDAFVRVLRSTVTGNEATGGDAGMGGGGIYSEGSVAIMNSDVSGNMASGSSGSGGNVLSATGDAYIGWSMISGGSAARAGGGIEVGDASLTIKNSWIEDNTTGDAPGNGGGLHVTGAATVEIMDSLIRGNSAGSEGGGLWNNAGATMSVTDSVVSMNTALGDDADNGGGGIFNNGGELIVDGGSVNRNMASGDSGSGGNIFSTDGLVTITDASITGGSASRAGGGIEIVDGALSMTGGELRYNRTGDAPGNGGALHVTGTDGTLVSIDGVSVVNNLASSEGGGLWNNAGSTMTVMNSTITGNVAQGDAADNGGGGLFNNGGVFSISDSLVTDNRAVGASGSGGGLLSTDGMVSIDNTDFESNAARRAGGGIEVIEGSLDVDMSDFISNSTGPMPGNGGAIHVTGGATTDIMGGEFLSNFASAEGGGVWNSASGMMTVTDSAFFTNRANGTTMNEQGGGAVFSNGGDTMLNGVEITGNTANRGFGDGVLGVSDAAITMTGDPFDDNWRIIGGDGDIFVGGTDIDRERGTSGSDMMSGGGANDRLFGLAGDDMLSGDDDNDMLFGNQGADMLTGGAGEDSFVYFNTADSRGTMADTITDFTQGEDVVNLSRIDADMATAGNQSFTLVGDAGLSGMAGELAYATMDGTTTVMADVDGDGMADFELKLDGEIALTESDFML